MAGSMGRRAKESRRDTDSASNLSFVNYWRSVNNQFGVRSSIFRIYPVSAKRSRAFQFRHLRSSDFDDGKIVQSNSFSRSISDGVYLFQSPSVGIDLEYFGRSISSGVVIGMDPFYVIRALVRRPNDVMSARRRVQLV